MLTAIFSFFKSNNLAALLLAAGLLYGYHTVAISLKIRQIESLERDNSILKSNQKVLEDSNKSIKQNLEKVLNQQFEINKTLLKQEETQRDIITGYLEAKQSIENQTISVDLANKEIFCLSVSFNKSCFLKGKSK